jgi:hypothetical protein
LLWFFLYYYFMSIIFQSTKYIFIYYFKNNFVLEQYYSVYLYPLIEYLSSNNGVLEWGSLRTIIYHIFFTTENIIYTPFCMINIIYNVRIFRLSICKLFQNQYRFI